MFTNFVSQLTGADLLGLWALGAVAHPAGSWAALTLRPMRLAVPLGIGGARTSL